MEHLYHKHDGIPGYRMIHHLLKKTSHACSKPTVYQYMKELGIRSVIMRKKPSYKKGLQHKLFKNLLKRDFTAAIPNQKWCTDFAYLTLKYRRITL
ncbi:IS3 family transposase [Cellulosilyticum sp. I15G10I2]|uniref:IS3 family transposase n=1 Tax=Cellulosilyticum sp. I15G10I2 TaxID=1892843 RepID=UPI0009F45FB8|nr:IS3 family transposase [Cellulosilyticum sp. I15G10I2]